MKKMLTCLCLCLIGAGLAELAAAQGIQSNPYVPGTQAYENLRQQPNYSSFGDTYSQQQQQDSGGLGLPRVNDQGSIEYPSQSNLPSVGQDGYIKTQN